MIKRLLTPLLFPLLLLSCKTEKKPETTERAQQENDLADISTKEIEFKVLDSKVIDNNVLWEPFEADLADFDQEQHDVLSPIILEKSIPEIQQAVKSGKLTYEELVKFYLFRIKTFDRNNEKSLNSVIALNPNVLAEARQLDKQGGEWDDHSLYGMPILLKDNINTAGMPTTAGAVALSDNQTEDAFITKKLKENGALILGKANLSEWAYFFCGDCPSGYSAVGGQTLNPYGRKILDTGGSSSGSGVATAANFAVAAVGTETSGSILSPSSANSVVGLKPTIGLLSRGGIVPISSTLDTPGPMTKNVIDNAIMLDALIGLDAADSASFKSGEFAETSTYADAIRQVEPETFLAEKRLGYYKNYEDSLYGQAIQTLREAGATLVEIERDTTINLPNFLRVLNLDMKKDLPDYIKNYGGKNLQVSDVETVTTFNKEDSLIRMLYGQRLFYGIVADSATDAEFTAIKDTLQINGRKFFDNPMQANDLDAVLSINNYMAGFAAVAKYPALTVPMGYTNENRPMGLTLIAPSKSEGLLLQLGYAYEQLSQQRKMPELYSN
ncbi:MAG: amidase family protein [Leeuwenhoekiella sp.]